MKEQYMKHLSFISSKDSSLDEEEHEEDEAEEDIPSSLE